MTLPVHDLSNRAFGFAQLGRESGDGFVRLSEMIRKSHGENMPHQGTYHNPKMHPTGVLAVCAHIGHEGSMIPNNIYPLRKRRGMTQSDLAKAIGTKLTMMGKLERGERKLTADWLQKLAAVLEVQPYELIGPIEAGQETEAPVLKLPKENTLREMLRASVPFLSGGQVSEELLANLAHKFALASRAVEERPDLEADQQHLQTLLLGIFLDIERSPLDKSSSG